MMATLDGLVEGSGAIFEAKFMLPWSFSEEAAAEKYMGQLQHNMWVTHSREAVLSIITGGGKWVEITIPMDPLYLSVLVSAEKKFWRCVQSGEIPHLINAEPPRPHIEAIRIVDMSSSNSWAEFAALFRSTRGAFPRAGQERTQGAYSRGCKGGDRARGARQALKIRRSELRSLGERGEPCSDPVTRLPRSLQPWRRRKPNSLIRKSRSPRR